MAVQKQFDGNKLIIIKSRKTIPQLGSITGPVTKPFKCSMALVSSLVNTGHDVHEIVNGKEIKLTPRNYLDNHVALLKESGEEVKEPDVSVTQVNQNKVAHIRGDFDSFTGGGATATLMDAPKGKKRDDKKVDDTVKVENVKTQDHKEETPDASANPAESTSDADIKTEVVTEETTPIGESVEVNENSTEGEPQENANAEEKNPSDESEESDENSTEGEVAGDGSGYTPKKKKK